MWIVLLFLLGVILFIYSDSFSLINNRKNIDSGDFYKKISREDFENKKYYKEQPLGVIKYRNYGLRWEDDGSDGESLGKCFVSYYQLKNQNIYEIHYIEDWKNGKIINQEFLIEKCNDFNLETPQNKWLENKPKSKDEKISDLYKTDKEKKGGDFNELDFYEGGINQTFTRLENQKKQIERDKGVTNNEKKYLINFFKNNILHKKEEKSDLIIHQK